MRVLVACEFSGTVREAFKALGHDAWSCDLLPTDIPGQHIQGDVMQALEGDWDLIIAHPPCTYLSAAGLHFCKDNPTRQAARAEAAEFVKKIFAARAPYICIENPVGWLSTNWQKPTQVVYMNDFGHAEARKPTCLWLKGLPKLTATKSVPLRRSPGGKRESEWYGKTKSPKARSKTFQGLADAMAQQWSSAIASQVSKPA